MEHVGLISPLSPILSNASCKALPLVCSAVFKRRGILAKVTVSAARYLRAANLVVSDFSPDLPMPVEIRSAELFDLAIKVENGFPAFERHCDLTFTGDFPLRGPAVVLRQDTVRMKNDRMRGIGRFMYP